MQLFSAIVLIVKHLRFDKDRKTRDNFQHRTKTYCLLGWVVLCVIDSAAGCMHPSMLSHRREKKNDGKYKKKLMIVQHKHKHVNQKMMIVGRSIMEN